VEVTRTMKRRKQKSTGETGFYALIKEGCEDRGKNKVEGKQRDGFRGGTERRDTAVVGELEGAARR